MSDSDGQDPIQRILGGTPDQPILTFERRYRTDPSDLWQAITDPDRLARWFGRLEGPAPSKVGDAFSVDLGGGGGDDHGIGVLTACRPPEHLAYDWSWQGEPRSRVEVTLAADQDHTTLLLTHRLAEPAHAVGYGGGWEEILGALAGQLTSDTGAPPHDAASAEAEGNRQWSRLFDLRGGDRELRLTRTLSGACEQVWSALTTRDGLATWWWNRLGTGYDLDLRVGGHYRFAASQGGFAVKGTYLEIERGRHLAYSWVWQDEDGDGPVDRVDITLTPTTACDGSGTVIEVWHRGPWSDSAQVENYRSGWNATLDELAAYGGTR